MSVKTLEEIYESVCDSVRKTGDNGTLSRQFAALSSDEQRVQFLLSLPAAASLAHAAVVPSAGKDASRSDQLRSDGNECYRRGQDLAALRLYTQAVAVAPQRPEGAHTRRHLCLALANRSAALLRLGHVTCSLVDTRRALLSDCPQQTRTKLLQRIGDIERAGVARRTRLPSDWQHQLQICRSLCSEAQREVPAKGVTSKAISHVDDSACPTRLQRDIVRGRVVRETEANGCPAMKRDSLVSVENGSLDTNENQLEVDRDQLIYISGDWAGVQCPRLSEFSPTLPSASSSVKLALSAQKQRHFVATRDIAPGEVLVVEPCYSAVVLPGVTLSEGDPCHHCCRWTPAPIPCNTCCQALFCRETCRDSAWRQYHHVECSIWATLVALQPDQMALLALRTLTLTACRPPVAGHTELRTTKWNGEPRENAELERKECRQQDETEMNQMSEEGTHTAENHRLTHKSRVDDNVLNEGTRDSLTRLQLLESHQSDRSAGDLFKRTVIAIVLGRLLSSTQVAPGTYKDGAVSNTGIDNSYCRLVATCAQLLLFLQIMPCNAHQVSSQCLPAVHPSDRGDLSGAELCQTGSASYPTLSLLNHSCAPNVFRVSHGTVAVLHCLTPIRRGQELLDNYGLHHAVSPRAQRLAALRAQYYFRCTCDACEEDTPLYSELPAGAPHCGQCRLPLPTSGSVTETAAAAGGGGSGEVCCCSDSVMLSVLASEIPCRVQLVMRGDMGTETRLALAECLSKLQKRLLLPWRPLNDAQEAFKLCYLVAGNTAPLEEPRHNPARA